MYLIKKNVLETQLEFMHSDKMIFHHIGVAVKDIDVSINTYSALGYKLTSQGIVIDNIQNVRLAFLANGNGPIIELVMPESSKSPVQGMLNRNGAGPYHTCYEVQDIRMILKDLLNQGFKQISEIVPAIAFDNREICFVYNSNVGVIELLNKLS